jgi:hypothetical protein
MLDATLKEEEKTDVGLTRLADADANMKAKKAA